MIGFFRSTQAEIWALWNRRQTRIGIALVATLAAGRVLLASLFTTGGVASHANLWPRFAEGAQTGLAVAELLTLVFIAGSLPREAGSGALRDPLARGVSRSTFLLSRIAAAFVLPLLLATTATIASFCAASLCFDGGHSVTDPYTLGEDPQLEAEFDAWLSQHDVRPDELAVWVYFLDEGLSEEEAAAKVGLAPFDAEGGWALPDDYWGLIPILQFQESEVRNGVFLGLLQGIPSLLALGLFALLLATAFRTGALASGLALGSVFFYGAFLWAELGEHASWVFFSWLPGNGAQSILENAQAIADGFNDIPPPDESLVLRGHIGALLSVVLTALCSLLFFRRKSL